MTVVDRLSACCCCYSNCCCCCLCCCKRKRAKPAQCSYCSYYCSCCCLFRFAINNCCVHVGHEMLLSSVKESARADKCNWYKRSSISRCCSHCFRGKGLVNEPEKLAVCRVSFDGFLFDQQSAGPIRYSKARYGQSWHCWFTANSPQGLTSWANNEIWICQSSIPSCLPSPISTRINRKQLRGTGDKRWND